MVIIIEDDGPGISEDQYRNVFKPFFRLDKSRSLNQSGVGLGLAIVKHIILVHNGEVFVSSSTKEKTRFTIALPLVETI